MPVPTRVDQTIFVTDPKRLGNCVAACVASYLGVPLEAVPNFVEFGSDLAGDDTDPHAWWWLFLGFMAGHGLWVHQLDSVDDVVEPGELLFVAGPSPRGVAHQVLYRDGDLWHDPHPSRAGLLDVTEVLAFRPARHDHQPTDTEGQD